MKGRFNRPPVEVLFDRICRENGVTHRLTPTSFTHHDGQGRAVPPGAAHRVPHRPDLPRPRDAQAELDAWVAEYNHRRPHQALAMATPADRFLHTAPAPVTDLRPTTPTAGSTTPPDPGRGDGYWVVRRASRTGVVCVSW